MKRVRPTEHTPKLSVVIPMYNEANLVQTVYARVISVIQNYRPYELIVVDDGSTDGTFERLQELHDRDPAVKIIRFTRNFGHQAAVTAGLMKSAGELVAIIDGDLQDPPETLLHMIPKLEEGFDVVYGVREARKEGWLKTLAYWTFYRLLQLVARIDIPLDAGDFCVMHRRVVDAVNSLPERNRFVRGLRSWVGFRQTGLPYARAARAGGQPKYTWRRLMRLALDGFVAFSDAPLRLASYLGFAVALGSFVGIALVLYFRVFTELSIPGFASVAILILFLGGIQLLTVGLLGEYLGRIYDEVKQRPSYLVSETLGWPDRAETSSIAITKDAR